MTSEQIDSIKKQYKKGIRVELINMDDIQAPRKGTRGTIKGVDDMGNIMVNWDNGSNLKLIVGLDDFKVVTESRKLKEEEIKESTPKETKTEGTNTQSDTSLVPSQSQAITDSTVDSTTTETKPEDDVIDAEYTEVTDNTEYSTPTAEHEQNNEESKVDSTPDVADNTTTGTSSDTTENQSTEANNQTSTNESSNNAETPKEKNTTPDDTAVAMSKVFTGASDLATALSKLTTPVSRVYLQKGQVFVENESPNTEVIGYLRIELPEYLRLSEAKALFQTKQTSLNNFLEDSIASYLNERGINITSITRDQTGKFLLSDGKNSYRIEDIKDYLNNTQIVFFDTTNPLTNDDLTKIRTMITNKLNTLKNNNSGTWALSSKKTAKVVYKVGNIIKSSKAIKLGESLIKKFKEDSTDILNTALSSYYNNKNKTSTDPQIQIQFFAYLYSTDGLNKPMNNKYAKKKDILDIANNLVDTLNSAKMTLDYEVKDNTKKKQVSQVVFSMGDEKNILVPTDKSYVAFSLVCSKKDLGEKNKNNVGKAILNRVGTLGKGLLNTLATASGAVINADRASANSTSAPKTL